MRAREFKISRPKHRNGSTATSQTFISQQQWPDNHKVKVTVLSCVDAEAVGDTSDGELSYALDRSFTGACFYSNGRLIKPFVPVGMQHDGVAPGIVMIVDDSRGVLEPRHDKQGYKYDAAYKAIDALTSVKVHLETYSMESVNAGIEAMATTKVVVNPVDSATSLHSSGYTTSRKFSGSGSDTDVVVSSARAYVAAVNKLIRWNMRRAAAEQVEAQEA